MGNPFKEASQDLLVLNSRDIIDPSVVATVRSIQKLGQEQCDKFVVERLEKGTASLYDPIKRNKLSLFSCPRTNEKPKKKMQIASLKTAWEKWCNFNDITEVFKQLGENPTLVALQNATPLLERFVVLMYDRTSSCTRVNEARKDLFTRKGRSLELIPPTSDALFHHMKRSVFQAGHVWGKSLVPCYVLPCPSDWGWKRTSTQEWEPVWTALPQASQSCQELLKCGCKSEKG